MINDVEEVFLRINVQQELSEEVLLNFEHKEVACAYHHLMDIMALDVDFGLQISQRDFISLYPIYYFLLEHLDLFRQSVVDVYFRARVSRPAFIANYRAIVVILSDIAMLLEGVGG